jgi:hypothetical protein
MVLGSVGESAAPNSPASFGKKGSQESQPRLVRNLIFAAVQS